MGSRSFAVPWGGSAFPCQGEPIRSFPLAAASEGGLQGSFAPTDWRLVKRAPDGDDAEIARHVLAFDLSGDGKLPFTDGRSTYLSENGTKRKISPEPMTDCVKWIEPGMGWK